MRRHDDHWAPLRHFARNRREGSKEAPDGFPARIMDSSLSMSNKAVVITALITPRDGASSGTIWMMQLG